MNIPFNFYIWCNKNKIKYFIKEYNVTEIYFYDK